MNICQIHISRQRKRYLSAFFPIFYAQEASTETAQPQSILTDQSKQDKLGLECKLTLWFNIIFLITQ